MSWKNDFNQFGQEHQSLSDLPDLRLLVNLAQDVANGLGNRDASAKQIRVLLVEVNTALARVKKGQGIGKTRDQAAYNETQLIIPKIAYAAGRARGDEQGKLVELTELFKTLSDKIQSVQDLVILRKFAESIVAFSKYPQAGGR